MISNEIREQIQYIVRGACIQGKGYSCSTVRNLLIRGFGANSKIKSQFESQAAIKEKQNEFLKSYALQSEDLYGFRQA